ncbi:response regulator transcription factor [Labilibaculum sp. DW002]|jgi:DNA-binding response OmpR family regulator|uniref:Response regulator transcription factor n=1 Tax=Paralabilibaculum antarcticum TaxID=2912572 RepID=A0ABT5W000_9BACT|nr:MULTISPECIES: response regulator transcription factor [unclassified Labilibaculum]MBI9059557.1 response regulator transcription factor [Labilibaculum sp.]MDE5420163.1 response regulator transcription factor [Labilibaculum sp. DW002]
MEQVKILLAEDDANLGLLLKEYLVAKGYDTTLCEDGDKAYDEFLKNPYDLCIFDIMMPHRDGFTLAKDIRLINSEIPIIFLTAKSMKEDVLEGFKLGADDYMTKPFSMEELLVRIEAVLRRTSGVKNENTQEEFKLGRFLFDSKKQFLQDGDVTTKLTTKESELLKLLCNNVNKVLERNLALRTIWSDDNYFNARSMDVYITKLRKHLKPEPGIEIINVHGKGYKLIM